MRSPRAILSKYLGYLRIQYTYSNLIRHPYDDSIMRMSFQLENRLQERMARLNGVCKVRSEIYDEGFDELIRQVTLNCPERGKYHFSSF